MTDTDSLAKVVAELRNRVLPIHGGTADSWKHHWNLNEKDSLLHKEAAETIERLDAEMRKEVESAQRWRDLYKASADTERAAADDAIAEIATLRARLAACEQDSHRMDFLDTLRRDVVDYNHNGDARLLAHAWAVQATYSELRPAVDELMSALAAQSSAKGVDVA